MRKVPTRVLLSIAVGFGACALLFIALTFSIRLLEAESLEAFGDEKPGPLVVQIDVAWARDHHKREV